MKFNSTKTLKYSALGVAVAGLLILTGLKVHHIHTDTTNASTQISEPIKNSKLTANGKTYVSHQNKVTLNGKKVILFPSTDMPYGKNQKFINKAGSASVQAYKESNKPKVLPSVDTAIAIVDSDFGHNIQYKEANNPFGMKGNYNGKSVKFHVYKGISNKGNQFTNVSFRKYPNLTSAVKDYNIQIQVLYLKGYKTPKVNPILSKLTKHNNNYKAQLKTIQKFNGSKNSNYFKVLNKVIQKYHLTKLDNEVTKYSRNLAK